MGRALRADRRPPLPRHHDVRAILRPERPPARRLQGVGGRPRHLGRGGARRGRRLDRLPPARYPAPRVRRCAGARSGPRAGDRPLGQLVQPGAVRQADRCAVGAGDQLRPGHRTHRRHLPPDLPLRVPVVHRRRCAGDVGRQALPARPRTGLRAVCRRLLRRPRLDRVHAGRRGAPHPGPAAERLDRADRPGPGRRLLRDLRQEGTRQEAVVEPGAHPAQDADGETADSGTDGDGAEEGKVSVEKPAAKTAADDGATESGAEEAGTSTEDEPGDKKSGDAADASAADAKPAGSGSTKKS